MAWADRMGRRYGQRPSVFLLDPDREAVGLDALAERIGREAEMQAEAHLASTAKAFPVFVLNRER